MQYKVVSVASPTTDTNAAALEQLLNTMATQGWTFVQTTAEMSGKIGVIFRK